MLAGGTVTAFNLDTRTTREVASHLTMPNGLARLPEGSFVVSRDLGADAALTHVADGVQSRFAPSATSTNGLAFDAVHQILYVSTTFNRTTEIAAVDVRSPSAPPRRYRIPEIGPLNSADDLTLGADSRLYVALNAIGQVARLDPATGASCIIASHLPFVSSVRFDNGPSWSRNSLYTNSFLGSVTKISPLAR